MIRPIKSLFLASSLGLVVLVSFAGGQRLRRVAAGSIQRTNTMVTSLPEAGIGGSYENVRAGEQGDDSTPAETFQEVLKYVKSDYVDRVDDDKKLASGAVRRMLVALDDPATRFLDAAQLKRYQDQINGHFAGIGAVVSVIKQKKNKIDQRRLAVTAPELGGPAEKAGLRAGDIITEVDGHWIVAYDPRLDLASVPKDTDDKEYRKMWKDATQRLEDGISLPKALDQLNTGAGKSLTLTVERAGEAKPLKIAVTTAESSVEPVESKALSDQVAYLRVTQFNDHATEMFTSALNDLKQPSLILDLRDNSGGPKTSSVGDPYNSAMTLLGKLTKGGQVATVVRSGNRQDPIKINENDGANRKVVVLVNNGTANLAEIVAAALKEKAGATLIGAQTAGDANFQRLVELHETPGAMTIRAGKLLTSTGADFADKGLKPDIALVTGGPHSTDDPAVQRAVSALAGA